jgi:hypothetical protein
MSAKDFASRWSAAECRQSGGWFIKIAERMPNRGIVREKLSEEACQKILADVTRK